MAPKDLSSAAARVAAASLIAALTAVAAGAISFSAGFNSDDVGQILYLHDLRRGLTVAFFGSDNFLLKIPIVGLLDGLMGSGRLELVAAAAIQVSLGAVILALLRWERGTHARLLGPLLVCWTFVNLGVLAQTDRPLVRNIELVLALVGVWCLDRLVARDRPPGWSLVAVAVATAILLFSDPYFTYLLALPAVAVLLVVAALQRRREPLLVSAALTAGIAASFILPAASRRLGLVSHPAKVELLAAEDAGRSLGLLASSALDPFGAHVGPGGLSGVTAWCNLAVVGVLLALGALLLARVLSRPREAAPSDLLLPLAVILPYPAYVLSGAVLVPGTSRYLVLAPLALSTIGVKALQRGLAKRWRLPVAVIVVVALVANLVTAVSRAVCVAGSAGCSDSPSVAANREAAAFARDARAQGITKLYTGYWDANFTTYWSHGAVDGIPLVCTPDGLAIWNWIVTDARINRPTTRSHVLATSDTLASCANRIEAHLGPPAGRLVVHGRPVLAYDGDLTTRLPRADP